MGSKPVILHIGIDTDSYFCGAESIDWADKYMTDEFASALPKCPDCLNVYEVKYGTEKCKKLIDYFENNVPMSEGSTASNEVPKILKTLRMYLDT